MPGAAEYIPRNSGKHTVPTGGQNPSYPQLPMTTD
jgi:hypothetical protein